MSDGYVADERTRREMLQPTESDITEAMLTWARKHGKDTSDILSLAPSEWASVWRMAQWHALKRTVGEATDRLCGVTR